MYVCICVYLCFVLLDDDGTYKKIQQGTTTAGATGTSSNAAGNRVRFSYRERAFKQEPPALADMLAVHFAVEGSLLSKVMCVVWYCICGCG